MYAVALDLYIKLFLGTFVISCVFTLSGAESSGGVDDMKRLHRALFENYNPDIRPSLNYSIPTNVTACLHVSTIMDLDIKNQVMKLIGYISLMWTDDLLRWDEAAYGGIGDIIVSEKKVWIPDWAIYNSVDDRVYLGTDETLVTVGSNGVVRWEPAINMGLSCKVDISKYPFDQNICTVNLLSWMYDNSSINPIAANVPIKDIEYMTNGQFWITSAGAETNFAEYLGKFYFEIVFKLTLKRRPNYLVLTLLVPVTLLAVLCVVSFLLSPEEPEKVSMAITVLLSFTVFLGVVDNDLPETSDELCLIVAYVVILLGQAFLCVAGNVVVVVIYKRDLKRDQLSPTTLQEPMQTSANILAEGTWEKTKEQTSVRKVPKSESNETILGRDLATEANVKEDNCAPSGQIRQSRVELSRAHRLNKYCLLFNCLALGMIIGTFFLFMIK